MVEYTPMRAILVRAPFSDPNRLFERKLDGHPQRAMCCSGRRATGRMSSIASAPRSQSA
jgi:hypothetical protein